METCLNCNYTYQGNYCNACGQKAATHRFTVGHVAHELPHQLLHLDKGIFLNIRSITQPGKTVAAYLSGKRVSFFNPMLFFFLTLGLILFLESALGKVGNFAFDMTLDLPVGTALSYNASEWMGHYIRYIYFGIAFLLAVPNYLLFRKETGFNYAEQVIATTFILGYANLAYLPIIISPILYVFPFNPFFLSLLLLFTVLVYQRGRYWLTTLKALAAMGLYVIVYCLSLVLLWALGLGLHQALD